MITLPPKSVPDPKVPPPTPLPALTESCKPRKPQFSRKSLLENETMLLALARQTFASDPAFMRNGKPGVQKLYDDVAQANQSFKSFSAADTFLAAAEFSRLLCK